MGRQQSDRKRCTNRNTADRRFLSGVFPALGSGRIAAVDKNRLVPAPPKGADSHRLFFPDNELRQYASDFNRASTQYHVSIETYGADEYDEENTAAYALLNAALASKLSLIHISEPTRL